MSSAVPLTASHGEFVLGHHREQPVAWRLDRKALRRSTAIPGQGACDARKGLIPFDRARRTNQPCTASSQTLRKCLGSASTARFRATVSEPREPFAPVRGDVRLRRKNGSMDVSAMDPLPHRVAALSSFPATRRAHVRPAVQAGTDPTVHRDSHRADRRAPVMPMRTCPRLRIMYRRVVTTPPAPPAAQVRKVGSLRSSERTTAAHSIAPPLLPAPPTAASLATASGFGRIVPTREQSTSTCTLQAFSRL